MMFNSVEQKVSEEKIDWEAKVKIEFSFNWPSRLAALQTIERILDNKMQNQNINWEKIYQACKGAWNKIFYVLCCDNKQREKIRLYYEQVAQGDLQKLDKLYYYNNYTIMPYLDTRLSFDQLLELLKNANCKLTSLCLGWNLIKEARMKEIAAVLINSSCNLSSLYLNDNHIENVDAKEIAIALINSNCKLSTLGLRSNQIGDEGAKEIAVALMNSHCKLTSLDLGYNRISGEGVKEIATALESVNCKLTSLDLCHNSIRDEGATALISAVVSSNCKLMSLYLAYNQIGEMGAKKIAVALMHPNCKLMLLDLYQTRIGDIGVKEIAIALMHPNCKLTWLNLGGNEFRAIGTQTIALAQKNNGCLCHLRTKLDHRTQQYVTEFNHQWREAQKLYTLFSHSDKNLQHLSILPPSVTVRCLFPYLYDIFKDELKQQTEFRRKVPVMRYAKEIIKGKIIRKEVWLYIDEEVPAGEFVYPQSPVGISFLAEHDHHFTDVMVPSHLTDVMTPSHLVPRQKSCLIS